MQIDPGTLLLIGAGCGLLCIVLFVLGAVLNVLGTVFELLSGAVELAVNLFNFGPLPGCGCVLILGIVGLCVGGGVILNDILSSCGTAQQVIFCRWLGY